MTLDEAIKHAEEVAEKQEKMAKEWHDNQVRKCDLFPFAEMDYTHENESKECAEEHRQLADWLKDYKRLLKQEPVLDKIRAEIKSLSNANPSYWHSGYMVERDSVFEIIDKYKSESEDK